MGNLINYMMCVNLHVRNDLYMNTYTNIII